MKTFQEGLEIGIDEAGRGPLFGRVYTAAVLLPDHFDRSILKDSKKFSNPLQRKKVSAIIREQAKWAITYADEATIDRINILQATLQSMHDSLHELVQQVDPTQVHVIVDGLVFNPYTYYTTSIQTIPYTCIAKGDVYYAAIAAASILAKVARDEYIEDLCKKYVYLDTYYGLSHNKGYGTVQHRNGILTHGITPWHRKSFAPCSTTLCHPSAVSYKSLESEDISPPL